MNTYRFLFILVCIVMMQPLSATAATLYLDPGVTTLFRGDAVTVSVRLMPDQKSGECINAVDAVISYPDNIKPVDVSIGQSIFNIWVESPVINKDNRTITFAGGIPNGYCGRVEGDPGFTNVLANIVFRSPGLQIGSSNTSNIAEIKFTGETRAYLNDGQGTEAPLVTLGSTFNLETVASPVGIIDPWREAVLQDDILPEEFSISLEKDTVAFGGEYFIVFSTTDKQTGISHYEVMEEPQADLGLFTWGAASTPWRKVSSPYKLGDQSLTSTIRVKAYDKAGNEYIATLIPDPSLQTTSSATKYLYLGIALGSALILSLIGILVLFWRKRKAKNSTVITNEEII
jgi:hypothetical protein